MNALNKSLDSILIGDIAHISVHVHNALRVVVIDCFSDSLFTAGIKDNFLSPCSGKCLRNSKTDPVASACDPCILTFQ